MKLELPAETRQLIKRTTSRCPKCHASCPAEVLKTDGNPAQIFLKRTCPTHGEISICISSDARFYWLSQGKSENANGCCAGGNCKTDSQFSTFSAQLPTLALSASDGKVRGVLGKNFLVPEKSPQPFEKLSTCLALIEIVNSCNLACPTCYADSPVGIGQKVDAIPLENLKERIQGVINRKGGIEILQLSGGEPTLHPQFFELVKWAQDNPGIDYLLLNTNGVRIAHDENFARQLGETFHYGGLQLYLQFDGVQLAAQHTLRGADLRATRKRAIERCGEMNLPITLAMTVTDENLPHLWEAIEFGLQYKHIRGISFQPMFQSGRNKSKGLSLESRVGDEISATASASDDFRHKTQDPRLNPLNTADIILAAVEQSEKKLRFEDFTPLPCGDPNCATIGYLLKINGEPRSISDFIDFSQVQGFLQNKIRYQLEDLIKCGCDSEPLGELLKKFEMDETNTFRIFIKPFMDASTWDEDRIDRCCTHVIRPDGKLDSFCRYYSGFSDIIG